VAIVSAVRMTEGINVLSLFDGFSCGQLALERVGVECKNYYASEVDKYTKAVTQYHYPNTVQLGDVISIDTTLLPSIDLLIGGSPCTDLSFAGRQNGMSTATSIEIYSLEQYLSLKSEGFSFSGQSYLFWEFIRVLKEVRPKYFLLENTRMNNKWEFLVTNTLRGLMGLPESWGPVEIDSATMSAQSRKRLYWTNIPFAVVTPSCDLLLRDVVETFVSNRFTLSEKETKYMYRPKNGIPRWKSYRNDLDKKSGCITANIRKGVPYGCIQSSASSREWRKLTPVECERLQTVPDNWTLVPVRRGKSSKLVPMSNYQRYKMLGNGFTVDVVAHILKGLRGDND